MADVPFERVKALLSEVRRVEPGERAAWLEQACGDDEALRAEVLSLLREGEGAAGLLDRMAAAAAAPLADALGGMQSGSLPQRVGRYRVLGLLGSGGMGAVYEAEQDNPRRRVALKMIRPGLASDEVVRRFEREAGVLGRLSHPGIAQIFEAGRVDLGLGEQPYFAMELVDGKPLTTFAEEMRLGFRARLELFARVCDAVHHAHLNGVVHRDLKPDNILVCREGTTANLAEDGAQRFQPKVLDFGVARSLGGDALTVRTTTGQLVGTLAYMSPEQVAGDTDALDARSDVYALGVLLFELLTGRLPCDLAGRSLPEAARVIQEDEPTRLSSHVAALRGDLDTIAAKALEKDRARRYASAAELGADVLRSVRHEPITARPASAFYRLRKFAHRNRALVGGVVIAFVALLVALAVSVHYGVEQARLLETARQAEADARFATYRAALAAVQSSDDPLAAREALEAAPEEFRGWEHGYLRALREPVLRGVTAPDGEADPVCGAVAYDGDGAPLYVYASTRGLVRVDVTSGRNELAVPGVRGVRRLAVSRDASVIAAVVPDPGELLVWRVDRDAPGALLLRCPIEGRCDALALSADGTHVAVHERESGSVVLAVDGGAPAYRSGRTGVITGLSLSDDGARLVVGGGNQRVLVVDAQGTVESERATGGACIGPRGERLAFAAERGVRVQQVRSDAEERTLSGYSLDAEVLAFARERPWLALGWRDRLEVWDHAEGRLEQAFAVTGRPLLSDGVPRFGPGDDSLLVATDDGAREFSLRRPSTRVLGGEDPYAYVYEAVFSPDGRLLAAGGGHFVVRLWDVASGELLAALPSDLKIVYGIAFSADGTRVLAANFRQVQAWDTALGASSRTDVGVGAEGAEGAARSEALRRAWWGATGGGARLTTTPGYKQSRVSTADHAHELVGTAAGFELRDELRDAARDAVVLSADPDGAGLPGDDQPAVAISPDGERIATGHSDGSLRLWSGSTGRLLGVLAGHTGSIYSLDFSPDGSRLVSGSRDGTLRVWHVERLASLVVLQGHADYVHSVCFAPDGKLLASGSGDGSVRLWDALDPAERARRTREDARAREALRPRVRAMLRDASDPAQVAARLRGDASLGELERSAALRELLAALGDQDAR